MIAAGNHRARATNAVLSETSTGKEQVVVEFELLDTPGERITWYGFFTEKTTESTLRGLRAAGWTGTDITNLSSLVEAPNDVTLVVEHERNEKDGQLRARVRWVNAGTGPALQPLAADKAKAFAAKLRQDIARLDQAQGAPRAPAKPKVPTRQSTGVLSPEPPPHTDDIPF